MRDDEDEVGRIEFDHAGGHRIQLGGGDGDGYCYVHQSYSCSADQEAPARAPRS